MEGVNSNGGIVSEPPPLEQFLQLILLLAVPCCSLLLLLLTSPSPSRKKKDLTVAVTVAGLPLPPSPPRGLPILGNLHQLSRALPHSSLRALAAGRPVVMLRLGRVNTVVVSTADAAREVMRDQDSAFASRPRLTVPRRLLYGCTDIAFAPHGAYWSAARKASVLHLLGPARVRGYRAVREEEVRELLQRVEEAASGAHGGVVPLSELVSVFAKDVAGRIVLGIRGGGGGEWGARVDALMEDSNVLLGTFHVGDFLPWLAWVGALDGTDAKITTAFNKIDHILEEIIVAAKSRPTTAGAPLPFVNVLMSLLQNDSTAAGAQQWRLTTDNVKALLEVNNFKNGSSFLHDLFGAGTDSTIIVLEWAMAELLRNKDTMIKLQHELRRCTAAAGGGGLQDPTSSLTVTEEHLPAMHYLKAVIKETMRLHPPGPLLVPRESMRRATVGGYAVPSKTMVVVDAWAIGRDPASWDRPEEFVPERFAVGGGGGGGEVDFRGRHFQLIPFGSGRRMCPGIDFAMAIVELALANLVAGFDWETLPDGDGGGRMDMEEAPGSRRGRGSRCAPWHVGEICCVMTTSSCYNKPMWPTTYI
uniref:Cytochrome P450 n=1 Tax=Oryza punctata TaxID=4537 RepID=A0A0E0M5R8_ORYPU